MERESHNQSGFGKAFMPLMILCGSGLIIMLQTGALFLLLSLLPSLVAYYSDHYKGKPSFKIVLACNFAATVPSLVPMLKASLKMRHYDISPVLQDPRVWLMVYIGAAAGWCLIFICRFMARFIVTISHEYNANALENFQKRLIAEWGGRITE